MVPQQSKQRFVFVSFWFLRERREVSYLFAVYCVVSPAQGPQNDGQFPSNFPLKTYLHKSDSTQKVIILLPWLPHPSRTPNPTSNNHIIEGRMSGEGDAAQSERTWSWGRVNDSKAVTKSQVLMMVKHLNVHSYSPTRCR